MSRGAGNYARFTAEQSAQIAELLVDGTPVPQIARILDMPYSRVRDKVRALAWAALDTSAPHRSRAPRHPSSPGKRNIRDCLSCHNDFVSEGPHNRLCPSCKRADHRDAGRFIAEHSVVR